MADVEHGVWLLWPLIGCFDTCETAKCDEMLHNICLLCHFYTIFAGNI